MTETQGLAVAIELGVLAGIAVIRFIFTLPGRRG